MRRSILCTAISLVLLIFGAGAFVIDMTETQKHIDSYNRKIDQAPDILKAVMGDERINLEVARDDASTFRVGLDMRSARINRSIEGGWNDPTISIRASEEAIDNIRLSKEPIAAFGEERDAGRITFQTNDLIAGAKLKVVLSSIPVLQFGYDVLFT